MLVTIVAAVVASLMLPTAAPAATATTAAAAGAAQSCEMLASLTLPHATIALAQPIDAGAFEPPRPAGSTATPQPQTQSPRRDRTSASHERSDWRLGL